MLGVGSDPAIRQQGFHSGSVVRRNRRKSPSAQGYDWNRSVETYCLVGAAMGDMATSCYLPLMDATANRPTTMPSSTKGLCKVSPVTRVMVALTPIKPAVMAPIPGLITVQQVDSAALAVAERRTLAVQEKAELDRATDRAWANLPSHYQWLKN